MLGSSFWGAVGFSGPPAAFAQTDPDDLARRHFESGAAYFEQAEYDAALREFEKAYELSKRPQILRNISVVQERLGNLAGAVAALDEYLATAPDDPDIDTVRIRRDNLKKRLEEQEAPPPPLVVKEDERAKEQKPDKTDELESESDPSRDFEMSDDDFDDGSDDGPNLVPAYVLITVGGLAGVGAAVTGYLASDEHATLEGECAPGCTADEVSTGENLALTSTVLTGVAVVGVGVGLIWWATADSGDTGSSSAPRIAKPTPIPEVRVRVGEYGGFGEARWRF